MQPTPTPYMSWSSSTQQGPPTGAQMFAWTPVPVASKMHVKPRGQDGNSLSQPGRHARPPVTSMAQYDVGLQSRSLMHASHVPTIVCGPVSKPVSPGFASCPPASIAFVSGPVSRTPVSPTPESIVPVSRCGPPVVLPSAHPTLTAPNPQITTASTAPRPNRLRSPIDVLRCSGMVVAIVPRSARDSETSAKRPLVCCRRADSVRERKRQRSASRSRSTRRDPRSPGRTDVDGRRR